MKKICVLFAGPVGCSKTPVAYYLSWNLGLPIFNNDAIRTEVHEDTLSKNLDNDLQLKIRNERLQKLIDSGKSFICDASIDRTWEKISQKLNDKGYEKFIISFDFGYDFLNKLYEAKSYEAPAELRKQWLEEHDSFLKKYGHLVDLRITEDNFSKRLEIAFKAIEEMMLKKA